MVRELEATFFDDEDVVIFTSLVDSEDDLVARIVKAAATWHF